MDDESGWQPPDAEARWDANDPRRQTDCFAPPIQPCECYCLHCGRVFMSDRIWLQRIKGSDPADGFWCCPTPNCGGVGFTFDIFPTDPDHPANEGWHSCDDDEDAPDSAETPDSEWDPDESKYNDLDEFGEADDDISGEEWKYGLASGQSLEETEAARRGREEWEARQRAYDAPDQRPREIDPPHQGTPAADDGDVPF
jgi:hypothetical protein